MLHAPVVGWACQTSNVPLGTTIRGAGSRQKGDHFIGLITSITICLVLGVLPEEESEQQSSIYAEEDDQNGYNERRSGNTITPYLLVDQHSQLGEKTYRNRKQLSPNIWEANISKENSNFFLANP